MLADAVLRQITGGRDVSVDYFGDRVAIRGRGQRLGQQSPSLYVKQFVILEVGVDLVLCSPFELQNNGDRVIPQQYDEELNQDSISRTYVAKPYSLQQTPWQDRTVILNDLAVTFDYGTDIGKRTATSPDEEAEEQVIVPDYFVGDVITAVKCPTGYLDPEDGLVIWMDLNTAARAWAAVL